MASFGAEKKAKRKGVTITHGAGHELGMRVPEGGSDCAKCGYVSGTNCTNTIFVKWNGSEVIPLSIDEYCCDEFETKEKTK